LQAHTETSATLTEARTEEIAPQDKESQGAIELRAEVEPAENLNSEEVEEENA
jgi:hypothetical protein